MILKKADWPDRLASLLRSAGYRKHSIGLCADRDTYTFRQPYWGGGSKESHFWLDLDGRSPGSIHVRNGTSWPAPPAEDTIDLPFGSIAVCGGTFCGKPATWFLHMSPSTAKELGLL